jgi:hypothetical protein
MGLREAVNRALLSMLGLAQKEDKTTEIQVGKLSKAIQ